MTVDGDHRGQISSVQSPDQLIDAVSMNLVAIDE